MFKTNDYLVYKKDVCKVKEVRKNKLTRIDYYILVPIDDDSLIIDVPTDNRLGYIRSVISKEEAEKLIDSIPNVEEISNVDDKMIERLFKELLFHGTHEDLIKIIKTTYLRNKNREENNKKISEKDLDYFNKAEKYLYNELSISLNKSFDETKEYVISKVNSMVK